jgi:hypothetical protein
LISLISIKGEAKELPLAVVCTIWIGPVASIMLVARYAPVATSHTPIVVDASAAFARKVLPVKGAPVFEINTWFKF